jgi:cobalt/nickel transport system permease protein
MTYRYIYVLLHTATGLFLARKSRRTGPEAWQSAGQWIGVLLGTLLGKSYSLSGEVYLAMQSRGFRGEPVLLSDFRMKSIDALWLILFAALASVTFYYGYWRNG